MYGQKYASSGRGSNYGPKFTTGDTIGVGINFFNNTILKFSIWDLRTFV
jgi:hypothetical protein